MLDSTWLPSEEDIATFHANGYLITPKLIGDERIALLNEHVEAVLNGQYETGRAPLEYWKPGDNPEIMRKADNALWSDNVLHEWAMEEGLAKIAARLLGLTGVRFWHDKIFYKPGGVKNDNTGLGWHQDGYYWQALTAAQDGMLTSWLALDDITLENGCMEMLPGSNHWGFTNVNDFTVTDVARQNRELVVPEGETFNPTPVLMAAGQLCIHHSMVLHRSGPNLTDQPRRAFSVDYMPLENRLMADSSFANHRILRQLTSKEDGKLLDDDIAFPIVYREEAAR